MTQPVQEPTTDRALQGFAYARDQIFRRPAPPASDDRPWARVSKPFEDGTFYPDQTINNNTIQVIDWDLTYNMDPGDSGETYFSTVGTPITALRVDVAGVYSVTAEVIWQEANTFPWALIVSGNHQSWNHQMPGYYDSLGGIGDTVGTFTMIHRCEVASQYALSLYQRSGGSRTLMAGYLEIVYLGSWTGIDLDDMLPIQ